MRVAAELGDIAATRRSANLAAKVAVAGDAGVGSMSTHYALEPLDRLDWITAALGQG